MTFIPKEEYEHLREKDWAELGIVLNRGLWAFTFKKKQDRTPTPEYDPFENRKLAGLANWCLQNYPEEFL